MKLLVTGGAGFIGSNFIRFVLKKHPRYKVVNLDKLTYAGNLSSLKDVQFNPNYSFILGDILDSQIVEKTIKDFEIDHIVHFAAESHVDRSIVGPKVFIQTNVVGTQVLLDAAVKYKIKRFHHVSTDEVFGSLPLEGDDKFTLETKYNPRSPYSASKAASDHLVRVYYYTYGLDITITNCSNNYGPYASPEKFFPRMITNVIDSKKIPIYGDGKYIRDWLYVEDHCDAILRALQNGNAGTTYLVGGMKKEYNNMQVAKKILNIMGESDAKIKKVKDRPGHDRRYAVDWSQTQKELGWKPKFSFDKGLEKTVQWYQENEWWWRPLKSETEKLYEKTGQL